MQKESLQLLVATIISSLTIDLSNKEQLLDLKNIISRLQNLSDEDKVELMLNCYHFLNFNDYEDNIKALDKQKKSKDFYKTLNRSRYE